ncbi:MAG: Undecaprenol kinase [Firmicutes bacterium ADurb.Bin419]|nr:MAG: Undecaprenol kinase [Firmicutes bacterium ADurb.Bin419]
MKNRNLIDSFNNAINGIISAIKSERNMKIHIFAAVVVFVMSMLFDISKTEFMIICIAVSMVIVSELFNTAVEEIVDMITTGYHPKVRIIKDVAAGAVLVSAFFAAIVGYFVFFEHVSTGLESGVERIRQYPMHITVITLCITVSLVLVMKAISRKGTPLKGGLPSGHAAIAAAITTAVALWSINIKITLLCIVLSLLVIQSRLEAKIHNFIEVFIGAVIGFLVTLMLFQTFL